MSVDTCVYGLSYRDVEELLAERGITVDHVMRLPHVYPFCYTCQAMIGFSAGEWGRRYPSVHRTRDKEKAPEAGAVGTRLLT